jgi:mobilome CxxCx(11)CxxC protein
VAKDIQNVIHQKRMDALSTKHLHEFRLASLSRKNLAVDLLAIGVPVLYFPIRYLAKGTIYGAYIEALWELLAGVLAFCVVLKMVYKWQERAVQHSKLRDENISLASQAERLLQKTKSNLADESNGFMLLADKLEKDDREAFGGRIEKKERQRAYREALKEFSPASTTPCPECGASPLHYKPGSCQLCGNTPITGK